MNAGASVGSAGIIEHPTLGQVIAYFKYQTTKLYNQQRLTPGAILWQRNYHERIAYTHAQLNTFRAYILSNPCRWHNEAPVEETRPCP
jgi:hypothetical protein